MSLHRCPDCGEALLNDASLCPHCKKSSFEPEVTLLLKRKSGKYAAPGFSSTLEKKNDSPAGQTDITLNRNAFRSASRATFVDELQDTFELSEEGDDEDDEFIANHGNWQKVIEHKTPPILPAVALQSRHTTGTSALSLFARLNNRGFSPRPFAWLSLVILLALLLGGAFGVMVSLGREKNSVGSQVHQSTLQISPATITLGGIVTLRGIHFSPLGKIVLSHDQHLPLLDTGERETIQADAQGSFSDTFIIDPSWTTGLHVLYAKSLSTGQQIAVELTVAGQSALTGPPHLLLSANQLNLGTGDETTIGNKLLALSNAGGGQVNWQATSNESWLQLSPKSGSIASGGSMSAMVAAVRTNMVPGSYSGTILFTSNTEQISLNVAMQVVPLQPAHQAVMQLSQATLTFAGTAAGSNPDAQYLSISNPGVQMLTWGANISLQNGDNWLFLNQIGGVVAPNAQQVLTVSVSTKNLAPGVYRGEILFINRGSQSIQGDQQSIYISLTVTPLCVLTFSPDSFTFTGTASQGSQGSLAAQSLQVGVAQGCSTSQSWSASLHTAGGGNWLSLSKTRGSTTSHLEVSVNSTSLGPGSYTGTITFTTSIGSQMIPVTLTLNPVPCSLNVSSSLVFTGIAGQSTPLLQNASLSTSGDCSNTITWTALTSGQNWLSASAAGTLTPPVASSVEVQVNLASLNAGSYTGTVTITGTNSVTGQTVGTLTVTVTLTAQAPPPCTLQPVSPATLTFTAITGSNPTSPTQSLIVAISGTCAGTVTITPSLDAASSSWLTISPSSYPANSGEQVTFTVTVSSSALATGQYTGTITLNALDNNGSLTGSPQQVSVILTTT